MPADARGAGAGGVPKTVNGVAALAAAKVAQGIPLTPGEQQVYDAVVNRSSGFFGGGAGFGYGGAPVAPAPRAGGTGADPLGIRPR